MSQTIKERYIHRFYEWPDSKQKWFIGGTYALLALVFVSLFAIMVLFRIVWPIVILPFFMITLASFADAPGGKRAGSLIYFSPLFIATKIRKRKSIIHAGTPFDYYFVFRKEDRGARARKLVLYFFLDGLLSFLEELAENPDEPIIIEGTSYFFNERTAKKLGFTIGKPDFGQVFILTFNFLPLMLTYSFTQGRWAFPNLNKVKTVKVLSGDLMKRRERIEVLRDRVGESLEMKDKGTT